MSLGRRETVTSVFWKFFEKCGSQAVSLVVQIVLARLLNPSDYGALAVMVVFVNVANVFVQSGFATSLVQAPKIDEEHISSAFWLSFCISLVLCILIWLISPFVAGFYGLPAIANALRGLSLVIPIGSLISIYSALISRRMQFKKFFLATILSVVASGAAGIGAALFGLGLWALVLQQLVFAVVNCVVLGLQVDWHPRFVFSSRKASELFSFGWKLLVSGLIETGYQSLSDLLIGKQFNASNLGMVSQGKKIPMTLGNALDGSIQPVMLSAVARVQDDVSYVKRLVRRALKTSTFVILPAMVMFGVAAEPIVRLLFGEKWLPCVPFFQMYCFIYALLPIHTTNLQALNGMGRSDLFLKLEVIKKSYGVVLLCIAVFVFRDVYATVGTYIITGIISAFVNAWPNRRLIGYSYYEQVKDICPSFVLAAVAGAAAFPIVSFGFSDLATIFLQFAVFAISYVSLAKLFKVEAFAYLTDVIKQLLHKRGD